MRRPTLIFIVSLFLFAGSLVAAFATVADRDMQLRGYVDATTTADLPFAMPRLGVNVDLLQYPAEVIPRRLAQMEAAGVTWLRQFISWSDFEPEAGRYVWEAFDQIAYLLRQRPQFRPVIVFMNTPEWARTAQPASIATAPPDDPADFARFVSAFTARYGDVVDHYQIWDEPNLSAAWGNSEPRAADYLALLSAAYYAIHSVDNGAQVLAAALAPTAENTALNISDFDYLEDLYVLSLADVSDGIAAKPYGFSLPPTDRTVNADTLNFSRIIAIREIMVAHGDERTPLWASDWGWNALPQDWRGAPSIWGAVTGEQQAAYTLEALERAEREWPWLSAMILHTWQPSAPGTDPQWGFALISPNGELTPLYNALVARQQNTTSVARNGLYAAANPYAEYSGLWSFGTLGADVGWVNDSQATFHFEGRDVALLTRQDDYVAHLYATVDGSPANALPSDGAGNAYLTLTSNSRSPELNLVPVAHNLAGSTHDLRLIADRGWDRWALDGYAVSDGNLATPYNTQVSIAVFTAILAGAASLVSAAQVNWRPLIRATSGVWSRLGNIGQLLASIITSLALLAGMFLTWQEATPALFRREPVQLGLALATAGLLYLSPAFALALVAAAVLFVIVYNRPDFGAMLALLFAPFYLFPIQLNQFPMTELVTLITSVAWGLRGLVEWGRTRQAGASRYPSTPLWTRLHALDVAVLLYVALGGIAIAWSAQTRVVFTDWRTLFLEPVLWYAIVRITCRDRRALLRLADALIVSGILVCLIGLFLYARGEAIITAEEGARRLASVYGSPNNVALWLERALPFVLTYALLQLDRTRRLFGIGVTLLFAVTLALTQSVGALVIGVPASLIIVLLLVHGRRALFPLLGLGALGAGVLVLLRDQPRFARLFDLSAGTGFLRLRVWESAVNMLTDYPLTGLGLDQFLYFYRGQYILPDAWQEPNLSHPHNFLLDWWLRLGILGVALLIFIQIAFWRVALRLHRALRSMATYHLERALVIGAMGSMAGLLAHGLVDNSIFVQDLTYAFMLLLAVVANIRWILAKTQ